LDWLERHCLKKLAEMEDWRASPILAQTLADAAQGLGGMSHGFFRMTPDVNSTADAQRDVCAAARRLPA